MTAFPPGTHLQTRRLPVLPRIVQSLRPYAAWLCGGGALGALLGLAVYFSTTTVHEARGSFLVNQLPFGITDDSSNDSETSRELVQSLLLSISSEGMKHDVAKLLGVPDASLGFTGHDRPVALNGSDKLKANIEITGTRNSRLGTVTAQSADPEFARKAVSVVFTKMEMLNQIAGRLEQIEFRLKLNKSEAANLVQEVSDVSADRIKFEGQNSALDKYLAQKSSLDSFPPFASDTTLSNLKTQYILVDSDYASVAAQSTSGARLVGKRGEVNNLSDQITEHTADLVRGLRSSLEIARTREANLQSSLKSLEQSSATLETERTRLAQGFGDFNLPDDLATEDPSLAGQVSVIVVVDSAYVLPRPVKPVLMTDLVLGILFGLGLGLAVSQVRAQFVRSASSDAVA